MRILPVTERPQKILFLVTEDWYFWSHRLPIARAARDSGFDVIVATRVNAHGDRIRKEGFTLVPLRLRRRRSDPWSEIASFLELVRVYRRERPAIVHHVAMKPVIYGSMAAALAGVPRVVNALAGLGYVFTSEGARAAFLRPIIRFALSKLLGRAGSRVIVQNPDDAAVVHSLGVPDDRIAIIPGSGVDTRRFAPSAEPSDPVVVCMVSRMLWDKGVGELVSAARSLADEIPALEVWLVGPPDPENPASIPESKMMALAAADNIKWLGQREDIAELWRRAHIAVLPSYREGLPKSLIEAAACAKPLIACDVPGSREIVVDGVTGLLVPARDADALARAIRRLASDRELRRRLGQAARERVIERFGEARVVDDTLALYRELLVEDGAEAAR